MRKIAVILFAQLLVFFAANAQFQLPDTKDLTQLKSKVLLVPMQEEVTRTLMDLQQKPSELQAYKDGIARFNDMLKTTVDKYWKLGKGVEYMPKSKVDQLVKEGNTKYVVLQYALREGAINQFMFGKVYGTADYNDDVRKLSKAEGYGVFRLQVPQRNQDPSNIYSVFLPVAYPSQGDMVYAIKMMNNELGKALKDKNYVDVKEFEDAVKKNNKTLSKRTLLIDATQVDAKTTLDDLQKNYSNPIQIVNYNKVNEAIVNDDSSYAFVVVVPDAEKSREVSRSGINTRLMHLVMDAGNENVLGTCRPSRVDFQKIADDISKKEVKDYVEK